MEIRYSLLVFKITNSSENQSHSAFRIPDLYKGITYVLFYFTIAKTFEKLTEQIEFFQAKGNVILQ